MLQQGIHNGVPMADYIGDPCEAPSLSTGVIQALVERSPLHAYHEHPRLGGRRDYGSARADLGSAAHQLLLGGSADIEWIDAPDYRTKAAQALRDAAREAGHTPMLAHDRERVESMSGVAKRALGAFGAGLPEQTMIWQSGDVWCRARPDYIVGNGDVVVDYKTSTNADPHSWIRTLVSGGYDIQAAHVLRGLDTLLGERQRTFVFLVQEIEPPFALSRVAVDPSLEDLGGRKCALAETIWRQCLQSSHWPGYDDRVHFAEAPGFAVYDFEARIAGRSVA